MYFILTYLPLMLQLLVFMTPINFNNHLNLYVFYNLAGIAGYLLIVNEYYLLQRKTSYFKSAILMILVFAMRILLLLISQKILTGTFMGDVPQGIYYILFFVPVLIVLVGMLILFFVNKSKWFNKMKGKICVFLKSRYNTIENNNFKQDSKVYMNKKTLILSIYIIVILSGYLSMLFSTNSAIKDFYDVINSKMSEKTSYGELVRYKVYSFDGKTYKIKNAKVNRVFVFCNSKKGAMYVKIKYDENKNVTEGIHNVYAKWYIQKINGKWLVTDINDK